MPIGLVRTAWSGTTGGPGITQTYFRAGPGNQSLTIEQATAAVNAMDKFWKAVAGLLPNEIVCTVSTVVDEYDIATGDLVDSTSATGAVRVTQGTSAAVYSMASGMKLNFNTGFVRNGRRVRGGMYLVPAGSNIYSDVGLVVSGARTTATTAGNTVITDMTAAGLDLVVYSRPLKADDPKGPRAGDIARVDSISASEKGAVLRGRRG